MDHDQLSIPPLIRRQRQVLPSAPPVSKPLSKPRVFCFGEGRWWRLRAFLNHITGGTTWLVPLRDLKRRWPDQGQGPEQDQRSCSDGPEVQATPPETGMV